MANYVYPLGCCKYITVSFAGGALTNYQKFEGLYIMEKPERIENEKIWKKHRPQDTAPKLSLRSSAPNNVDEWYFQDDDLVASFGYAPVVRSKPVSNVNQLRHCPNNYTEWEYMNVPTNAWIPEPDVKVLCVTETTSKYNISH